MGGACLHTVTPSIQLLRFLFSCVLKHGFYTLLNWKSIFRLRWLDINIWNCYASRRIVEAIIRIEWRCYANGSYFINTTIYPNGGWSKGYSGNFLLISVQILFFFQFSFPLWVIIRNYCFISFHRNFYSRKLSVASLSKNYWVNYYEINLLTVFHLINSNASHFLFSLCVVINFACILDTF